MDLGVYALTAFLMTYPAWLRLSSVIAGSASGDAYESIWSLWYGRHALLRSDGDLSRITWLNHPAGLEHPLMRARLSVILVALPFSLFLPLVTVYNIQIVLAFVLSGMSMYWLTSELTSKRKAGLVGGFVFAFFLNKSGHLVTGHLSRASVYWVPLYVLFLRRTLRKPKLRSTLKAAFTLLLACLAHPLHLGYLVLPVTLTLLLATAVQMKGHFLTRRRAGSLILILALAAVTIAPVLPAEPASSPESGSYFQEDGAVQRSFDLVAFAVPSPHHPVLRPFNLVAGSAARVLPDEEEVYEGLAYPGILATALALWGLPQHRRRVWIWGLLMLVAALLSLGPILKVRGVLIPEVPMLHIGSKPDQLAATLMFAVAVLASYGMASLSSWLALPMSLCIPMIALLLAGIGFEHLAVWPFPTITAEIPPTIQAIAAKPDHGALLYLQMEQEPVNDRALYYQTSTRRPVVGGTVHSVTSQQTSWTRTLSDLVQPRVTSSDIVSRPTPKQRVAWLRHFDVDYVLSAGSLGARGSANDSCVEALLGSPRYEGPLLSAFAVPDEAAPLKDAHLYYFVDPSWYQPERDHGSWQRRMRGEEGLLHLYSACEEPGSLQITAGSPLKSPVLEIHHGDQRLDAFVVDDRATYTTRVFTLTQGMNALRFHAPEEYLDIPDEPSVPHTFVFDHVSFISESELPPGKGLDISFGDQIRLRGWYLSKPVARAGDILTVTLHWQALTDLNHRYVAFLHLVSPEGALIDQHDAPALERDLPPSAWPAGTIRSYQGGSSCPRTREPATTTS
ncbi:MAG: hypothetical protein PVF54_00965 [Anaerolineae bacterium]